MVSTAASRFDSRPVVFLHVLPVSTGVLSGFLLQSESTQVRGIGNSKLTVGVCESECLCVALS